MSLQPLHLTIELDSLFKDNIVKNHISVDQQKKLKNEPILDGYKLKMILDIVPNDQEIAELYEKLSNCCTDRNYKV